LDGVSSRFGLLFQEARDEDSNMRQNILEGLGLELLTHDLRGGLQDSRALLEQLAQRWQSLLPHHTTLDYHSNFLGLGGKKGLARVRIHLGNDEFVLENEHGRIGASRKHVVHKVALSSETLPLELWLEQMLAALETEAQHSRAVQDTLEQLARPKSL